jgi:hypothetical protein
MTAATVTPLDATRDERRAALVELADLIDTEDRSTVKPLTPVLRRLVLALCSRKITDPDVAVNLFSQLVGAVADFHRFTGNETDWLLAHELPDTDDMREAWHGRLDSGVQCWAGRLMPHLLRLRSARLRRSRFSRLVRRPRESLAVAQVAGQRHRRRLRAREALELARRVPGRAGGRHARARDRRVAAVAHLRWSADVRPHRLSR